MDPRLFYRLRMYRDEHPMPFLSSNGIILTNRRTKGTLFSAARVRRYAFCVFDPVLDGYGLFVLSARAAPMSRWRYFVSPRRYTICVVRQSGEIRYISDENVYTSRKQATADAHKLRDLLAERLKIR